MRKFSSGIKNNTEAKVHERSDRPALTMRSLSHQRQSGHDLLKNNTEVNVHERTNRPAPTLRSSSPQRQSRHVFLNYQEMGAGGVAPIKILEDDFEMPTFGLGDWSDTDPETIVTMVSAAIDAGYRHIDCISMYENEKEVGEAVNKKIAEGIIKRENIFITAKLWNDNNNISAVRPALMNSLKKLNLTYVDMYLMHWPILQKTKSIPGSHKSYCDTFEGMIIARNEGLTKSVGVTNFDQMKIEEMTAITGVQPANLQVELNLIAQQPALLEFCRDHYIAVSALRPLGKNNSLLSILKHDRTLDKIAKKKEKTLAQILLRYLVELGVTPIVKASTTNELKEYLDVFNFKLDNEDVKLMKTYDKNESWLVKPDAKSKRIL